MLKTVKVDNAVNNPPMGPVINKRSQDNCLRYINKAVEEGGTIIAGGNKIEGKGFFVEPTIIKDVERNATISQEEIFGPVLAVLKANDFDDAISIANNTMFGLTGAIYTKNKKRLHKGAKEFFAGNLYLNRKCTGALSRRASVRRI
jgi:1-pyrroline-5-carboxylate dehydrogenase